MKGRGGGAKKIKEHILKILLCRPKSQAEFPDENSSGRSKTLQKCSLIFRYEGEGRGRGGEGRGGGGRGKKILNSNKNMHVTNKR